MATALNQIYSLPAASSDAFLVVALGGGTAPILLDLRTGNTFVVDDAVLSVAGGFSLFTGGAAPNPVQFPVPSLVRVLGSSIPFRLIESGGLGLAGSTPTINGYVGYWMPPGSSATAKSSEFASGLFISIIAEALIQSALGSPG